MNHYFRYYFSLLFHIYLSFHSSHYIPVQLFVHLIVIKITYIYNIPNFLHVCFLQPVNKIISRFRRARNIATGVIGDHHFAYCQFARLDTHTHARGNIYERTVWTVLIHGCITSPRHFLSISPLSPPLCSLSLSLSRPSELFWVRIPV